MNAIQHAPRTQSAAPVAHPAQRRVGIVDRAAMRVGIAIIAWAQRSDVPGPDPRPVRHWTADIQAQAERRAIVAARAWTGSIG